MLHVFNALCERSCIRRLSAYFAVLPALLLAISLIGPRAQAQTACNVVYTISPQNTSAFGAAITIQNTGTTALIQLDADLDLCQRADSFVSLERH